MNLFFLKALLNKSLMRTEKFEKLINEMPSVQKRYHQVEASAELKEYQELEALVKSSDYDQNTKKAARLKKLSTSRRVKQYQQLEGVQDLKESDQKKLQALSQHSDITEWKRLQDEVKDYSQQAARYAELSKNADILFYLAQDVELIKQWDRVEEVYSDTFDKNPLQNGWKAGFVYPSEAFKAVHSQSNQQQSYTGGKNTQVENSRLIIRTKKEKNEGACWHPTKGMVMEQFDYSSDVINSKGVVELTAGSAIQVKASCNGKLNHSICLRGVTPGIMLSVLNYTDKKLYCGVREGQKKDAQLHLIDGLKPKREIIYTVEWSKDEIVWYVNNLPIHRTKNTIAAGEKLSLHLYSYQQKGKRASEGQLSVDWIKTYRIK